MDCPRCQRRGQTWNGDAPKCAFRGDTFDPGNWNCATMNDLRQIADDRDASVWSEDQWAAVLPYDGEHIVLGWYKRRGRTETAFVLTGYADDPRRPLTYRDAESAIWMHREDVARLAEVAHHALDNQPARDGGGDT